MVAKVVGIRRDIDFSAQDGSHIQGAKLYVEFPPTSDGIEGVQTAEVFIPARVSVASVCIGSSYLFQYDYAFNSRKPRLVAIEPV